MNLYSVFLSFAIFCLLFHESRSMQTRIVNGSNVDITSVPFMLSLRLSGSHACGATIISEKWGLTAAHCVATYGINGQHYSVRSGSTFRNKNGKIHNVTRIISHELYNDLNTDYDLAVFRVKRPFKFDKTTRPIDLPGNNYVDDKFGIIAGWGYFRPFDDELSENLQYAVVPKVERTLCSNDYAGRYELTPEQVCYGYRMGGKDACKGDSGGPLFTSSGIMIGITSWGDGCGETRLPGVYTTIFSMLDWIYNKTGVKSRL